MLSSVVNTSDQLLPLLLADAKFAAGPPAAEMFRPLAQILGTRRKDDEIQRTFEAACQANALLEVALGVGEGLQRAEGVTETVLRRDIAQLSDSGLSLMPEGMESAVTIEQMADLIAFRHPP